MNFNKSILLENKLTSYNFLAALTENGDDLFKTVYIPKLRIYDFDHASTSKIKKRKYFKLNYQSMKIITQKYFTNE